MKRRQINVFSLSFLDCICCGLGAIILLFVIVNAKSEAQRERQTVDLSSQVTRLEQAVLAQKKQRVVARNALSTTRREVVTTEGLSRRLLNTIEEIRLELARYTDSTLASKSHVNRLKADLKSLEEELKRLRAGARQAQEGSERLRPFPGTGDRHYLTDLKVGGGRNFILVDASASMLDNTLVEIIRRRNQGAAARRRADKWQHAVATVEWLTAQLPPTSRFQIYAFNETARPLVPGSAGQWLDAGDPDQLDRAVKALGKVLPEKGTSLANAFGALAAMKPRPDNIFLLVDSLPTQGAKTPWRRRVSARNRLKLFDSAVKALPAGVPVNIILFPMEGDPHAASAFWRLAVDTRGSFFCPPRDWP